MKILNLKCDYFLCNKNFIIRIISAVIIIACMVFILKQVFPKPSKLTKAESERKLIENLNIHVDNDLWIPAGGTDIDGWPQNVVPNIVHYVLFQRHRITYVHMLSIFSVIKIQNPEKIIIHCDCDQTDLTDKNWNRVLKEVNKTNQIEIFINTIVKPTTIYGKKLHYANHHASDVTRWRILSEQGGIYIDNDVFICHPLDEFFKYEFTLNWDLGQYLGSQVLMGNRNARFPKLVLETYKAYNGVW